MIDASIPLQARTPQIQSPIDTYARLTQLKNMLQQNQMGDIQLQTAQLQQKQAEEANREVEAFNQALKANTTVDDSGQTQINHEGVMNSLAQSGSGNQLMSYKEKLTKLDKEQLAQEEQRIKTNAAKAGRMAQLGQSAVDQATYQGAIAQAVSEGLLSAEQAKQMPQTFEEAKPQIEKNRTQALGVVEYLNYQAKMAEEAHNKIIRPLQEQEAKAKAESAEQKVAGTEPMQPAEKEKLELEKQKQTGQLTDDKALSIISDPQAAPGLKNRARTFLAEAAKFKKQSSVQTINLPYKTQTKVDQYSRQFSNEAIVKKYNVVSEATQFASSLSDKSGNPADDMALIYAFAKAMDPDSVVREGEYATVQKYAQSWAQKFGFDAMRVLANTEFLAEGARANLKKTIAQRAEPITRQYENLRKYYAKRIDMATGQKDGEEYLPDYAGAFSQIAANDSSHNQAAQQVSEKSSNQGNAGQTVKLQAPDGTIREVPADQVDHYIQLGAKRVQ